MKSLSRTLAGVLIIGAVFVVYWPALRNGFVWDDTALVLRDPLVRSWWLIPEGFRHFLFLDATASNFYRPLQRLTFVADYQFYGFAPAGWHFTSILLHAAAAVAFYAFAERLLREKSARGWPRTVALIWAIHPIHTSAVTYISGRADSLAALFGFSGLALGLMSLEDRRRWPAVAAAACFLGALWSKESGVVALLIWFSLLAWRRSGWHIIRSWLLISAMVLGCYSASRFSAQQTPPPPPPVMPLAARPILAARAWAEYAGLLAAPVTLRMERDVRTLPQGDWDATLRNARQREYQTLAGALLMIAFGAFWWRQRQREPLGCWCFGAFLIAYVPVSNVFSLNATVAEHWLYLPSAFLLLGFSLSLNVEARRRGEGLGVSGLLRAGVLAAVIIWVGFLGWRTWARQGDWREQRTFIGRTIESGGDTARMRMNLANLESAAGRDEAALAGYAAAVERAPEQPYIRLNQAAAAVKAKDFVLAHAALAEAEKSPRLAADCAFLAATLEQAEGRGDGGKLLRRATELDPESWRFRERGVRFLVERGEKERAVRELGDFIAAHPFRAESWRLLGELLEQGGRPALAWQAYEEAAERDVHDVVSRKAVARLDAESRTPRREGARGSE